MELSVQRHTIDHALSELPSQTSTFVEKSPDLASEIQEDERRVEAYGGDDPREPPKLSGGSPSALTTPDQPNPITWDGPDDPENPQNWSRNYKWFITAICSLMTVNVTFASSAPASTTLLVVKAFGIPLEVSYLLTSLFLLGYVAGPIVWGPGSEVIGRRSIFCVTMSCYTLFILGQALAPNATTLLVTRFLSGFFACAPVTNSGGVIADIWDPVTRGVASSIFSTTVFLGPVLGPIVASFIVEDTKEFRWVFWVMMIFAGVCTVFTIIFLPETYAPKLMANKAKRLRMQDPIGNKDLYAEFERQDWTLRPLLDRTIGRPFKMLIVEPILLLVTIYMGVVYGVLYALFEAIPYIFQSTYGFSGSQSGLVFIGIGIGTTLGTVIFIITTRKYPQLVKEWRGFPPPEQRLYGAMIAGPSLVIGAFWLGWTGNYSSVHWIVPALSTIVIGMSISLIFISFISYIVDVYLMYAASALAANTIVRSAVGAAFPLFTEQMFGTLGINWACTLIALISVVLAPIPFFFFLYGARIRGRSKFAPCIDLKIAAARRAESDEKKLEEV